MVFIAVAVAVALAGTVAAALAIAVTVKTVAGVGVVEGPMLRVEAKAGPRTPAAGLTCVGSVV